MRTALIVLLGFFPAISFASERLEVLKLCLKASDGYSLAGGLFLSVNGSAAKQRADAMPSIAIDISKNRDVLEIAGGPNVLKAFGEVDTVFEEVLGATYIGALDEDVIKCRNPDKSYDCKPYFVALTGSAAALKDACATDYREWKLE